MLTREGLQARPKAEKHKIASTGDEAFIRVLTGTERVALARAAKDDMIDNELAFRLFLGDGEAGGRMFGDSAEDIAEASAVDGRIAQDVFLLGLKVNAIGETAVDDAVGNSESAAT